MVGLTSWQALKERLDLRFGQKLFIPAGAGGIGSFAIQLAKQLGAKVGTTTSTGNVALVRALGADELCAYLRAKGAPAVSCDTAAEGVRRALEESGGETPVVACGSLYLRGEIREAVKSGR